MYVVFFFFLCFTFWENYFRILINLIKKWVNENIRVVIYLLRYLTTYKNRTDFNSIKLTLLSWLGWKILLTRLFDRYYWNISTTEVNYNLQPEKILLNASKKYFSKAGGLKKYFTLL
jgi:hypothetical protein